MKTVPEPTYAQACEYWSDLPNIWTPVGWKNHMFRFNVLWNGTILAQPHMNRRTRTPELKEAGTQIAFMPGWKDRIGSADNNLPASFFHDDGMIRQGWNDDAAPVLRTEWSSDGLLVRQEVFAHIPGGGDVQTGIEPIFAWVRLSVLDTCPALPLEDVYGFHILVEAPHLNAGMSTRHNIMFLREGARYPRALTGDAAYDPAAGFHLLEPDGRVRLGIAPRQACAAVFNAPADNQPYNHLRVRFAAKKGAAVILLLPILPTDRATFDAELAVGWKGALREANRYWAPTPKTAASISVAESFLAPLIRRNVQFSEILGERNPATGKYCKVNGSWVYCNLWTTPGAMDLIMMMDTLGYHDAVRRYLDIFRDDQGAVLPPGPAYTQHPGYLSTPPRYKSIDWLSDNGAVLYTLAMHGLLSGDRAYIDRFTDCIVKSCEWIRDMRALKDHGGYEGVLPPAVATDAMTKIQAVWSVGWNYKGLCAAVRLLRSVNHPRADEFAREADDYKRDFLKALRHKCGAMPTWKDARGRRHALVPTALAGDEKEETRHAFYLDGGPLFLVFSGLVEASDPLMAGVRQWFREGPQHAFYRRDSNCWQVPVLDREMSSCEPCYSWNVFHSWELGDRARFLEGMYSIFAGSVSRQTGISCETRGGITGTVFAAPLAIYLARLAIVDDQIRPGELHLLRLAPLAWLVPGRPCRFENVPTEFGPVSVVAECGRDRKTLRVACRAAFRSAPARVVVHVPPMPGLRAVTVNGQTVRPARGRIALDPAALAG